MTTPLPQISSILCLFQGDVSELNALDLAFGLARRHSAALRILHVSEPPVSAADPFGAAAYAGVPISSDIIDQIARDDEIVVTAARRHITERALRYGVRLCRDETELASATQPAALFVAREDFAGRAIAFYAKGADLIVAPRQDEEGRILPVLIDSGNALIVAPPEAQEPLPQMFVARNIAIAWDGSVQAARALDRALPMFKDATAVYLICVRESIHPHPNGTLTAIATLNAYGIEPVVVTREVSKASVGLAILDAAHDREADLLVMGAYGHHHVAEALLGGTSRYVLHHAGLPVLMAH